MSVTKTKYNPVYVAARVEDMADGITETIQCCRYVITRLPEIKSGQWIEKMLKVQQSLRSDKFGRAELNAAITEYDKLHTEARKAVDVHGAVYNRQKAAISSDLNNLKRLLKYF